MTNLLGRKLGKYEVVERLASGGMGEVYKAFQPGVERYVAIKVMHPHLAGTGDFVQRFQREARSIGRLLHPHILSLIDFDVEGGLYYMVLEYIPGGTLRTYLNNQKQMPVEEALRITGQLADALAYAHQQGMIHRDIKPGNVMFADENRQHAVLTDFGIARLLNQGDMGLTQPGALFGTPAYMSPEAMRGETLDGRADIYSLGVLLYEMVTGQRPYIAETPYSLLMKMSTQPLPPPRKLNPSLPQGVQQVLYKALAQEPAKRFQSAAEFSMAVKQLQADLMRRSTWQGGIWKSTGARTAPVPSRKGTVVQTPTRNRAWLPWASSAVVLILLAVVILLLLRNRERISSLSLVPPVDQTATREADATDQGGLSVPTDPVTITAVPFTPTASPTLLPIASPSPTVATAGARPMAVGALWFADNTAVVGDGAGATAAPSFSFTLVLTDVVQPADGQHYALWVKKQLPPPLNLGRLTVSDGAVQFTDKFPQNPFAETDSILITLQADSDAAAKTMGAIVYYSMGNGAFHSRLHPLLAEQGLLLNMRSQWLQVNRQVALMDDALQAGDEEAVCQSAEVLIHLLDGKGYDDVTGDGQPPVLDDRTSVRAYIEKARTIWSSAATLPEAPERARAYADLIQATQDRSLDFIRRASDKGIKICAADTVADMQPFFDELETLLTKARDGEDRDGNGVIDPLNKEGAILALFNLVARMGEYPIYKR